jgi:hypothetical protein
VVASKFYFSLNSTKASTDKSSDTSVDTMKAYTSLSQGKPKVEPNWYKPEITLLPKNFDYYKQKGFSIEAETYISIGYTEIPGFLRTLYETASDKFTEALSKNTWAYLEDMVKLRAEAY